MSKIIFDDELDKRIEFHRRLANNTGPFIYTEADFRHYLFTLGLLDYEFRILPKRTGKPYKPYYSLQGEILVSRGGEILKDYSEGETA